MTPVDVIALGAIGAGAGFLAGLLGIGGGLLMVPAMVLALGFDQHVAQGTSLVVIIPAALVGTATHHRSGRVSVRDAVLLAVGGVLGAAIGSVSALSVDDALLRRMFGVFLLAVAAQLVRGRRRSNGTPEPTPLEA